MQRWTAPQASCPAVSSRRRRAVTPLSPWRP